MRFKNGQKIVCIKPDDIIWDNCFRGPRYNEIVTVHSYHEDGTPYIRLFEYYIDFDGAKLSFFDIRFEPLAEISELTSILESEPQHERV